MADVHIDQQGAAKAHRQTDDIDGGKGFLPK
jgi:hypothetical protein